MIAVSQSYITRMVAADHLNPQPDGTVTVSWPDGRVMSVNSYGTVETRPTGTAGPQEKAVIDGNLLIFSVTGDNGSWAYAFPFTQKKLEF